MKAIIGGALRLLGRAIAQIFVFLLFFAFLGFMAAIAKESVSAVGEFHWIAGVVLGTIWLIGVLMLCLAIWYAMRPSAPRWFRNYVLIHQKTGSDAGLAEQFSAASLSALICAAILTAVFALTAVSAILQSQSLATYAIESSHEQPMTELLFRLYMWHTIDMIPFINIWETFDIKPPIRPAGFLAQLIVLVFRTAIIGFAISVIVQWLKFQPGATGDRGGVPASAGGSP